jgi:N-dimethylarginine dimethylaminohydrolase
MCAPDYFDVTYEINAWMTLDNPVNVDLAKQQWAQLYETYTQKLGWDVQLIQPVEGLPDMVFTANGGLVIGGKTALPTFRHPARQGETPIFRQWFSENGLNDQFLPLNDFEGEGDALVWNNILFVGYPWRSDKAAHAEVQSYFGDLVEVVPLQLAMSHFYHLDTALTIVNNDTVALFPGAFTKEALETIRQRVPNVILASREDANAYGLNAMSNGECIVLSDRATGLIDQYNAKGMTVFPVPISEFQKSGGGVKCLTLELRR